MYLLIKEPGLIFQFNNKEYLTPVEFEFDKKQLELLLMQLRNSDITNFFISPTKIVKNKSRVVENINKTKLNIEESNTKQNNNKIPENQILNLLLKLSDKLNNIEKHIHHNKSNIVYQNVQNEINNNDKKEKNNQDLFIPDIDLSGMDIDLSENIKSEKQDNNQENTADLLRKLLGD